MRQNSMLGSVAKYASKGIRRPQRLRGSQPTAQQDTENKDFPLEHLQALIGAATSWRDKALWLLLAASGIRTSEARNMLLEDVAPEEQRVYVIDPNGRRFKPPPTVLEQSRFKGRAIAATYLFPPLRQWFFDALEQYLKLEYVPTGDGYLFQYVEPARRGDQMKTFDDYRTFSQRARTVIGPLVVDLLAAGQNVVMDFPANTRVTRAWFRSLFESAGADNLLHSRRLAADQGDSQGLLDDQRGSLPVMARASRSTAYFSTGRLSSETSAFSPAFSCTRRRRRSASWAPRIQPGSRIGSSWGVARLRSTTGGRIPRRRRSHSNSRRASLIRGFWSSADLANPHSLATSSRDRTPRLAMALRP